MKSTKKSRWESDSEDDIRKSKSIKRKLDDNNKDKHQVKKQRYFETDKKYSCEICKTDTHITKDCYYKCQKSICNHNKNNIPHRKQYCPIIREGCVICNTFGHLTKYCKNMCTRYKCDHNPHNYKDCDYYYNKNKY